MTICNFLKSAAISALLAGGAALPAHAVFFHIGSGSIDGSLCVGNDCVASPAFGFDTVILRENNLRILLRRYLDRGGVPAERLAADGQ